jgi:uncharacterized repeat protein (TIGR01451 family)
MKFLNKRILLALFALSVFLFSFTTMQALTSSEVRITNTAEAVYIDPDSGKTLSSLSNTIILELVAVANVRLESNLKQVVTPGELLYLTHTLSNFGNITDSYSLRLVNSTDDDADLENLALYYDKNANGLLDTGEVKVTRINKLSPDKAIHLVIVGKVPANVSEGMLITLRLSATSLNKNATLGKKLAINTDSLFISGVDAGSTDSQNKTSIRFLTPTADALKGDGIPDFYQHQDFADAQQYRIETETTNNYDAVRDGIYIEIKAADIKIVSNNRRHLEPVKMVSLTSLLTGDSLKIAIRETAAGTGIYRSIRPIRLSKVDSGQGHNCPGNPNAYQERQPDYSKDAPECVLRSMENDKLQVTLSVASSTAVVDTAVVEPLGRVFDSSTLKTLAGMRIRFMTSSFVPATDPLTGLAFPEQITNSAGQFQFPNLSAGKYYISVSGKEDLYQFPSLVAPDKFSQYAVSDYSYGESGFNHSGLFTVSSEHPTFTIDIPVDPVDSIDSVNPVAKTRGQQLAVTTKISSSTAGVGDVLSYMVTIANHTGGDLTSLQVHDYLPQGFSLIKNTVSVENIMREDIVVIKGRSIVFNLSTIADGSELILRYSVRITAIAEEGNTLNSVYVSAKDREGNLLESQTTHAKVLINHQDVFASQGIIFGKVHFAQSCGYNNEHDNGLLALGGVRIYLEDGRYAITDASGDYTFYSLESELHTVKVDVLTLPENVHLKVIDTQQADDPRSYIVDLSDSSFSRADFVLDCLPKNQQKTLLAIKAKNATLPDMDFLAESGFEAAASYNANKVLKQSKDVKAVTKKSVENKMLISKQAVKKITYRQAKKGTWLWPKGDISTDGRFMVAIRSGVKNPVLYVNDNAVSIEKMGEQLLNKKSRGQVLAWYGVDLREGENNLEVRGRGPRGKMRILAKGVFKRPSRGVRIKITPLKDVFVADGGKSVLPLKINVLDKLGYPAIGDYFLTIEASEGTWLEPDLQDANKGHQVKISNGKKIVHLRSSNNTGRVKISVRADALQGKTEVMQTAYLRPLFVTGYLNIKATSGGYRNGRTKLFMQGKVFNDKHLILSFDSDKSSHTDSGAFESEIANSFYPLKGEASTHDFNARSRAKIFAKLEKNKNSVLYGDYSLKAFSADDLAQTQQSLTGVETHLEKGKTKLQAYAAYERDSRVVEEFRGNGTAFNYQLKSQQLIADSELVELIVRDKNNLGLLISNTTLQRLSDYTLDAVTGYLSFHRVIPSLDENLNPVYIRVTYNRESNGKKVLVTGMQIEHKISNEAKAGASYHRDNNREKGYRVGGVYLDTRIGEDTALNMSAARMTHNNGDESGNAYKLSANKHWTDTATTDLELVRTDKGFTQGAGVADRQEIKLTHQQEFNQKTNLTVEASHSELLSSDRKKQALVARLQTRQGKWLLKGGIRHYREQTDEASTTSNSAMVGIKRGMKIVGKAVNLGVNYEQDIKDANRRHTTLSADLAMTNEASLYAKYESGNDFAASPGFNSNTDSDRLVVGAKHKMSASTETYSEYRSQKLTGSYSAETATGFRGSMTVEKGLTVTPALEVVKVSKGELLQDSLAASVSVKDVRDATNKKYLRAEIRQGENDDYYALEGNYIKRLDNVWSAYAGEKLRVNKSDQDGINGSHELTLGLAQRQRDNGKHNGLYLYQWKEQRGTSENADSSTHILSTHQNYRVNEAISISGRVGGKLHTSQIEGQDYHSDTVLFDGKASYALNDKVDVYAHGGVMASDHFNEQQYSAGIGANMTIDRNLRVGIGYNNSGFNDEELDPDKQNKDGFFVNLILKADETLFDWLNWKKKKHEAANDTVIKAGYIAVPIPHATVSFEPQETDSLIQKIIKKITNEKNPIDTAVLKKTAPKKAVKPVPVTHTVPVKKLERIETSLSGGSYFATGSDELSPEGKVVLSTLVKQIKHSGIHIKTIIITGHTDNIGSREDNYALSKYRAQTVAFYLANQGINYKKIRVIGMGETSPIATNQTAKGRAMNRRVSIVVNGVR